MIDLRSDTVTKPTPEMRRAMADAEVGDDVYGEDPSVLRLEERTAELLGKQAALFVPSGTMANQIALQIHCRPGDEVIIGKGAHLSYYEGGAAGAWAGVQFVEVGETGLFTADDVRGGIKPNEYWLPRTRLVAIENTHNRAGGRVFPQHDVLAIADAARSAGLSIHLDGARIWNAATTSAVSPAALCAPADTVSACFSKGLGAPVGSVIAGTAEHVLAARRLRRMLGGGMRQAGILAAAALYALEHHMARLADDHTNAAALAHALAHAPNLACASDRVETNLVVFDTAMPASAFVEAARQEGVLLSAVGPHRLRAVTHLGITRKDIDEAALVLGRIARR